VDNLAPISKEYQELYELQDRVMDIVFGLGSEFYLTGGTCLSRFYQAKRYSDDLDFFTNDSPRFSFAVREIRATLAKELQISLQTETKHFVRLVIDGRLQVDFVNDSVLRDAMPIITPQGYLIDTIDNILSNKLTALIGRDNPKDMFDLILIYTYYPVDWKKILMIAHQKAHFSSDDLLIRLSSFPKQLLDTIQCIDCTFLQSFDDAIANIMKIILSQDNQN
jgi:predicted nucleotidyltransferase component of viral defense system